MKRVIGKIDPNDRHVTIWGAGFSGLVLGYYLKNQGYRITIYEKTGKPGGKLQSKKTSAGLVEKGPNALYLNGDGLELLRDLKLEPIPASKKLRRLLMINGKPRRPLQLGILSKLAFNSRKKPPLVSDGLTVAEFFRPLLGNENIHHFLSPALSGVYAASSENLHFKTVFDQVEDRAQFESYFDFIRLLMKIQKSQPKLDVTGSVSFNGGVQALTDRLAENLKGDIKYNYKEAFRVKGNTILCTDAINAASLTKEVKPEISAELNRITYQEMSSVTVFLKREIKSLQKAFGVLIPDDSGYHSIGIVNNKAIFPTNYENVQSYTFIGRKKLSDDEILEDLRSLSSDITRDDIDYIENTHWEKAIPLYDLQRFLSVKKLHQIAKKEANLAIFGNYVAGISLREMITAAKSFAKNPTEYPEFK